MMAKNKNQKKEAHGNEYLENPEALADQLSKTEAFIENNKALVFGVVGLIVLVVAGIFGYRYYVNNQEEIAQNEMFQAIYYFESDSLGLALNGDGNNLGFVDIADEYSITDAGNLANFYAGTAYLKQGKYELAILYLEDFNADDLLVQSRAYSLIGDAHMELGEYEDAASFYQKAASHKPTEEFTPTYLVKSAIAYEKANDLESAKSAYQTIVDDYSSSSEYQKARKNLARLGS